MNVKINGNKLLVELDINETPEPSRTGKTLILASTGGFTPSGVRHQGKDVKINVTAIVKPDAR